MTKNIATRRRLSVLPLVAALGIGLAGCDTGGEEAGIAEEDFTGLEERVGVLEDDFATLEQEFGTFQEEAGLGTEVEEEPLEEGGVTEEEGLAEEEEEAGLAG